MAPGSDLLHPRVLQGPRAGAGLHGDPTTVGGHPGGGRCPWGARGGQQRVQLLRATAAKRMLGGTEGPVPKPNGRRWCHTRCWHLARGGDIESADRERLNCGRCAGAARLGWMLQGCAPRLSGVPGRIGVLPPPRGHPPRRWCRPPVRARRRPGPRACGPAARAGTQGRRAARCRGTARRAWTRCSARHGAEPRDTRPRANRHPGTRL